MELLQFRLGRAKEPTSNCYFSSWVRYPTPLKEIWESWEKTAAIPKQEHQDITTSLPAQGFSLKSNYLHVENLL